MQYIILMVVFSVLNLLSAWGYAVPINKSIQSKSPQTETHTYQSGEADTVRIAVDEGWNLISLPLIVPDSRVIVLFSNSISSAFSYDGSYKPCDTLEVGKGYWLKFADADTISMVGSQIIQNTLTVNFGWNIIGTITLPCYSGEIISSPLNIIVSEFYKWDSESGYVQADSLIPGEGYFVKCSLSGNLLLQSGVTGPTLVSPANWSENVTTSIRLQWRPMVSAINYHVQVSKDPSFSTINIDDPTLSDTIKLLCNIEYDERFFWRVRTIYLDSVSDWSIRWSFHTMLFAPPPNISDTLAIFASVDGDTTGLWLFDPNTLEIIDTLILTPKVPFYIETSPGGALWYSIWNDSLYALDAHSKIITQRAKPAGSHLSTDKNREYLIVRGTKLTQFWYRADFSLVHQDSIGLLNFLVASPTESKLYSLWSSYDWYFKGILVYDLDAFCVERTFPIADSARQNIMQPTAFAISTDGRYLYTTVFNWGAQWWGSFHVIDLTTDSLVAEYPCGAFAQIGVSPDGEHVYLTDPAGYLYGFVPTRQVLRYSVETRTMEVYIDWRNFPGLEDVNISDQIVVSPDSRTMFLTVAGGRTCDGTKVQLVKLDVESKNILATFEFWLNNQGYPHLHIRRLKLEEYFK